MTSKNKQQDRSSEDLQKGKVTQLGSCCAKNKIHVDNVMCQIDLYRAYSGSTFIQFKV